MQILTILRLVKIKRKSKYLILIVFNVKILFKKLYGPNFSEKFNIKIASSAEF